MNLSKEIALTKLQQYCAYQDRCHSEVRNKLLSLKIYGDDLEEIISELIQEKYLDELRFAKSYARGKFRIKKWGKNKIKQNLKAKQVSDYCIKKAMQEIDDEEYIETLKNIISSRIINNDNLNDYQFKLKVIRYCQNRGYELDVINELI